MRSFPSNLIFIPVALLVIAVLPLPYGYYTLLRVIITFACAWLVFIEWDSAKSMTGWAWIFACMAALFNPIFEVHLTRGIWFFLDLGAAAVFVAYSRRSRAGNKPV